VKYLILLTLHAVVPVAIAQTSGDSVALPPVQPQELISVSNIASGNVVELRKTRPKARRKIQLREGQKVWVEVQGVNGKMRLKKCRLIAIADHEVTFKPYNGHYPEVTYADTALAVIGFTTTGRIILASAFNTVVVSVGIGASAVVVVIIVLQAVAFPFLIFSRTVFTEYSFRWVGDAFEDIGLLFKMTMPFVRKIKFPNKKWKLEIVKDASYLAQVRR